mgnify:CR=1 FL=1
MAQSQTHPRALIASQEQLHSAGIAMSSWEAMPSANDDALKSLGTALKGTHPSRLPLPVVRRS